ncbi:MAG: hypothetical protein COB60_02700 [Flavobacteriaceae bacterium]|nr:MAG: hypothetical protein COB60_02700 [Flavobacteriaceae bacterium]
MKKVVCMFLFFVGAVLIAQEKDVVTAGVFEFETETIDYGRIHQREDGYREFKFKNIGKAPIIIATIKSSCGCSVAMKPSKPTMPGESGSIRVKYDTNRLGGFSKTFMIGSNAQKKSKRIRIKGIVLQPVIAQN